MQQALSAGDAKALMEHAGERVEIALLSGGSVYSRGQAIYVMQRFFKKYPPRGVELNHVSASGGSQFAEGTYRTSEKRALRLYLQLSRQEEEWQLQEVRVRRRSK